MKDKLVIVIGGGGFLGRYVTQELLKAGARVRIAQRDPREALFLKPQGGLGQIQFVAADVGKPETIARALAGADAVVNLAGSFSNLEAVLVTGARTVAEAAAAAGVASLVHISAIGADPESPAAYGRAKAAGEAAVQAAFHAATILRPSIIFGREDQFVNRFAAMISALPVVPVLRAGARFQPVYVTDVAQAVVAALGNSAAAGKVFELGGPDIVSMGGLIRWIARAIGRNPAILELPDVVGGLIAFGGFLPGAPITRDQWRMLARDTVVTGADGLAALGVTPTPMDAVAPGWLVRYRRHGRFGAHVAA
ncbi:complex I NDUFA9 subunit family protein [Sphingomonas oligophenolica]|uniref:Complex I NDUFA9 subunit family protein n=1 Tax=Sphingomonas oligophenolica TaxID=301154 RepID=A0ABU9Y9B9_9SPHN